MKLLPGTTTLLLLLLIAIAASLDQAEASSPASRLAGKAKERPLGKKNEQPEQPPSISKDNIRSIEISKSDLWNKYSPKFEVESKKGILDKLMAKGKRMIDKSINEPPPVRVAQAVNVQLPQMLASRLAAPTEIREGAYTYDTPAAAKGEVHWWANFADLSFFAYYGALGMSSSDRQVLEMPLLASVHEFLKLRTANDPISYMMRMRRHQPFHLRDANNENPRTEHEPQIYSVRAGNPAPAAITGIDRWLTFDTGPRDGAPAGLDGEHFANATPETAMEAAEILPKPQPVNILAMETPDDTLEHDQRPYDEEDLQLALATAYAAFSLAKEESRRLAKGKPVKTIIHSGNWGSGNCNDVSAMAVTQAIAARAAGVKLVAHAGDKKKVWDAAIQKLLPAAWPDGQAQIPLKDVIASLMKQGFKWHKSNGE